MDGKFNSQWELVLPLLLKILMKPFIETIHIPSENSEVYIGYKTTKIMKDLFGSLVKEYQKSLKRKMKKAILFLIVLMH